MKDDLMVNVTQRADSIVLTLRGTLDLSTAAGFERHLAQAERDLARGSQTTLVLDMKELGFLDSTGLRAILGVDTRMRDDGCRLVLVRGPESVDRVFRMTLLDELLSIVDDWPDEGAAP